MQIRLIQTLDAAQMIELNRALDTETDFMLMEPGERTTSLEQQVSRINAITASDTETLFVAEDDRNLVGFIAVASGMALRSRHTARLVIGIKRSHWGLGVSDDLMMRAEQWAKASGVRRLELTVMTANTRALSLYGRHGFVSEGTRACALLVGGVYVDEFYMAKLI